MKKTNKISPKNRANYEEINKTIENLKKNNLLNSYLGNKGYTIYKVSLDEKIINFIKSELIAKPFVQSSLVEPQSFPIYQESTKKIYVPRFWGLNIFGEPKEIKISQGKSIDLKFTGQLRDYQENVINHYFKSISFDPKKKEKEQLLRASSSALIELTTGGGKTVLALKILEMLKKKTIIFVQKTFLKNQWIERIQQFLPDAKIGSIQGPLIDIENKDIVIAMVQSISMKSYPDSLFDEFGLTVFDEVHHMSSEVFCNCLKKCNTLYGLGLSATMERKDGLTNVFKMYLGDICYKNKATIREDNVLVKAIDYIIEDDDEYNEVETDFRGNIKHTTMISKVAKYDFRNDFILNVLYNEFKIKPDQQIILLSQTKNMLNYLHKELTEKNVLSCGYYVGGMKAQDLKISETKQVILATYSMAAEALDIPTLTTLVLATSKSDIVQAVGRILRMKHERPMIIDIIDQHSCFLNQFNKRRSLYNERNYKIIRTNNTKYIEYIKQVNSNITKNEDINSEDENINEEILNSEDKNIWQTLVYKPRKKNNKVLINTNNTNNNNQSNSNSNSKSNVNEENSGICLI